MGIPSASCLLPPASLKNSNKRNFRMGAKLRVILTEDEDRA